jgi:hypothetical protein
MKNRHGTMIGALAAVLTLAGTAASAATVYVPAAPTYAPAPASPENGNANVAVPIPGTVLDDKGNPLPPCHERGPNGVEVIRGTGCMQ